MTKKVLFVLKFREHGGGPYGGYESHWGDKPVENVEGKKFLHSGLYNSANFVCEMLRTQGIEAKLVHCSDNNAIHGEIMKYSKEGGVWNPVTDVIIEAFWVVPEKFDVLEAACPWARFIVRNHSETPFLANEGIGFDWTLRYVERPRTYISCNAPRMLADTRFLVGAKHPEWTKQEVNDKVPYLPNFYPLDDASWSPVDHHKPWLDVGCFGAIRPLKNHIVQAVAAIKFAEHHHKGLRFHINAGRVEMNGSPILNNLRGIFSKYPNHELVEHAWRPHAEFKQLIRSMDIVSQISLSETFNIVAADAVSQGVALVGTKEIPWMSALFHADPTDSESCADAMIRAYALKRRAPSINLNIGGLHDYNRRSIREWVKHFGF